MSFLKGNEFFIRIKFQSEMRGMSLEERITHYNKYLRIETLERLKNYFNTLNNEIAIVLSDYKNLDLFSSSQIELDMKRAGYIEVISLFRDYEFETILCSLYFDHLGHKLNEILMVELIENIQYSKNDKYLLAGSFKKNDKSPFLTILNEKLGLNCKDWEDEGIKGYPILYKLVAWLNEKLFEKDSELEIQLVLFHYTKLWNLNHVFPSYDEKKGIVLLNGLISILKTKISDLKVDLSNILLNLSNDLCSLHLKVSFPPFLEHISSFCNNRAFLSRGYSLKSREFEAILRDTKKFLVDFRNLSFKNLLDLYADSDDSVQKIIYELIIDKSNLKNDSVMVYLEYLEELIIDKRFQKENDSQNLINYFYKVNYAFDRLIFQ